MSTRTKIVACFAAASAALVGLIADLGIVKGSTGRNDDLCTAAISALA
jgi:hypothetical protein